MQRQAFAEQRPEYASRVKAQIAQYADTVDMHALPDIFHVWSNGYLLKPVEQVFGPGTGDAVRFYADAFKAANPLGTGRILSIGCGDGSIEIGIAQHLKRHGIAFELLGADLSPVLLATMRDKITNAGLGGTVRAVEADLNAIGSAFDGPFDLIMAHHALHHIVGLEDLFHFAKVALTKTGIFATQDMIGRNGHQRWPEARAILETFWPLLSDQQRYNAPLQRLNKTFTDHDCSSEGFEGIRAQDILPLLLQRLHPARFVAAGGFIDLMVDRGYGPGFNVKDERDVALIRCLADLNETLLDAGLIKPTIMMAWFTKQANNGEIFYRDRRAQACVRGHDPDWIRWYRP